MGDTVGQRWGGQKVWGREARPVLKGEREKKKKNPGEAKRLQLGVFPPKSLAPCILNGFHLELELPMLLSDMAF